MNLFFVVFILFERINGQCEYFEGPRNPLETYCQSEIEEREFKMVVRDPASQGSTFCLAFSLVLSESKKIT